MQEERGYNITQEFSTEDFVPNYAPWNVPADANRCSIALIIVFKPPQFLSEHMTLFHSYLGLTVGFLLGSLVLGADNDPDQFVNLRGAFSFVLPFSSTWHHAFHTCCDPPTGFIFLPLTAMRTKSNKLLRVH